MINVPSNKLSIRDSFAQWVDKINTSILSDFDLDYELSEGLNLVIKPGKFTDGSRIGSFNQTTLTLPADKDLLIALITVETNPRFEYYEVGSIDIPSANIIPLFLVTTTTEIAAVDDVRTWANVAGGGTSDEGVLLFRSHIVRDQVVPIGKNAISVEPTIEDGVTVTVSEGSVWSIV